MRPHTILRWGLVFIVVTLVIRFVLPLRGASPLDTPVRRAQLRVISDTTSGSVYVGSMSVSLNAKNETQLNYPSILDEFTYDLMLTNVATLGDITELVMRTNDGFGWRPKAIELIVNDTLYFEQTLTETWKEDAHGHYWFLARRADVHASGPR